MKTKNEIFDEIMEYVYTGIYLGFFTEEEAKEIQQLENEYYIQCENEDELYTSTSNIFELNP